jgi:polyferredoxin
VDRQAGQKLFGKKYNRFVPHKLDRALRHLRYAVLAMVLYQTAVTAKLVFQAVDPYYALFNFFAGEVALTAYITLGAITVLSLFVERPWCKYFCPYGAFLGLFNRIRIFKIRRDPATCVDCKQCDRICPMNIEVSKKETVSDAQCISCHKCTSDIACPVKDTVTISAGKERARIEN